MNPSVAWRPVRRVHGEVDVLRGEVLHLEHHAAQLGVERVVDQVKVAAEGLVVFALEIHRIRLPRKSVIWNCEFTLLMM